MLVCSEFHLTAALYFCVSTRLQPILFLFQLKAKRKKIRLGLFIFPLSRTRWFRKFSASLSIMFYKTWHTSSSPLTTITSPKCFTVVNHSKWIYVWKFGLQRRMSWFAHGNFVQVLIYLSSQCQCRPPECTRFSENISFAEFFISCVIAHFKCSIKFLLL